MPGEGDGARGCAGSGGAGSDGAAGRAGAGNDGADAGRETAGELTLGEAAAAAGAGFGKSTGNGCRGPDKICPGRAGGGTGRDGIIGPRFTNGGAIG